MKTAEQKKLMIAAAILVVAGGILAWQFWPRGSTPLPATDGAEVEDIRPNMRMIEPDAPKKGSNRAPSDK
jgi:hypothetical protein